MPDLLSALPIPLAEQIYTPVEDIEANYFAMCLLMPERFVRDEIRKIGGIDIADDRAIRKLARIFAVPETAMAIRLGQLMGAKVK